MKKRSTLRNDFGVAPRGRRVQVAAATVEGVPMDMTPHEALELAAWLVAIAAPMHQGTVTDALNAFHSALAEAAEGTDLEGAALGALEQDDDE